MATSGWTKWMKFDKKNLDGIPKASGIYEIKCPTKVRRLIGVDKDGILYIGWGKLVKNRLTCFPKQDCKKCKSGWHSAYHRFHELGLNKKLCSVSKLSFRYKICTKAKNSEGEFLKKYQKKHGELPQLNTSGRY